MTKGKDEARKEVRRELQDEHGKLHKLQEDLLSTKDVAGMSPLADELHRELKNHFEREEAGDGLWAIITDHAPRHYEHLQKLLDEHKGLLAAVEKLRELARQSSADAPVRANTVVLQLKDHEARETELISDAIYTDLGGGD